MPKVPRRSSLARAMTALSLALLATDARSLQIQIGTVRGRVVDPSGAVVPGATVVLYDRITGFERSATTGRDGNFSLHNLPFRLYRLRVQAPGLDVHERELPLRSNLPVHVSIELSLVGATEAVTVEAASGLVEPDRYGGRTRFDPGQLRRVPGARPSAALQEVIATAPGWTAEDNGLLHARGVDDGFLFVTDGIPLPDRVDRFFSSSIDTGAIESLEILDGHIPAEYGYASGGVIHIVPRSGLRRPWTGTVALGGGSERTAEIAYAFGGRLGPSAGLFVTSSLGGSARRFLDPVDPENFNNRGKALRFHARLDWQPSERDQVVVHASANGSGFRVPNSLAQEEAGQRQRQELRDDHQSLVWQRSWSPKTVTDVGVYRHAFRAELFPSPDDTPISAEQSRRHAREGALASLTRALGAHTLEAGLDLQRVTPRERFVFFVTDEELGVESGLSEGALARVADDPFLLEDEAERWQGSGYVQDTFSLFDRLTVNAGIRFDFTAVLVRDRALGPRVAAVYFFPETGTAIRGSFNRLFKHPQVENLLLSSSPEARELSPFADEGDGGGGAEVRPERQRAYELGFSQAVAGVLSIDAAYWWRRVRDYADPNVFFGTTILFPNAVAQGEAAGLNLRLQFPRRGGVSGFVSYSNSLVYQRGPILGGLFLEEEVAGLGAGERFIPDHDQRNVGAFGITYHHVGSGFWASLLGRHESGTPLEVDEEKLDELEERRGADLVDFDRRRVKPRTLFDLSLGIDVFSGRRVALALQLDVRNLAKRAFAYNFANPFSGTHFGHPRLVSARARLSF